MDSFIFAPSQASAVAFGSDLSGNLEDLLRVQWTGDCFTLMSESGYERESMVSHRAAAAASVSAGRQVTETEDVSYVSSAYLPECLRHGMCPTCLVLTCPSVCGMMWLLLLAPCDWVAWCGCCCSRRVIV